MSIPTSQKTNYVFCKNINRLMLFSKTIAAYCENHMKYTLCGQNVEFNVVTGICDYRRGWDWRIDY
jgi:hypothetical protein